MGSAAMEGWWRKGVATALVGAVVLVALTLWRQPQPTVLESAILPPRAFRRWFYETTHRTKGPVNEVPLDRFAGRGRGRRAAATVPGYLDKEANQARLKYQEDLAELTPEIKELDEEIAETATWDHGHGDGRSADGSHKESQELKDKREALDAKIAEAKENWRKVQDKVDAANKELVYGRVYQYNKDDYLGGSDHFVPVGVAHKQLAGGGYGHRYSIVDWLSGDRR